ncbi:MAG: class I SAM-dependent methyltransferase [Nitrospira sp.]|nr:class I SAM-dependent methyltransferase [Nitrospira sp.]
MWLRLIEKVLRRLLGKHLFILSKECEGVLCGKTFASVDFRDHQVVDKKQYLITEKGKYKFVPRPDWIATHAADTSVQVIVDNAMESYDEYWADERLVSEYLVEARKDFYREVLNECDLFLYGNVIDVGCGPGFFSKVLSSSRKVRAIYGTDFSSASIKRCRQEVPEGHFFVGDIYRVSCQDGGFDTVVCMETLEHLEQPAHAIAELFRLCKVGGHVIITIPNGALDEYVGHINFWTEQQFRALLSDERLTKFRYCSTGRVMLFVIEKNGVGHTHAMPHGD